MMVTVNGEGDKTYPVLSIDRWGVYLLGNPDGSTRSVGADRVTVVPETAPPSPDAGGGA